MPKTNRRDFIQATGNGIIAAAAPVMIANATIAAPNERIRHAVIGTGGQGRSHCRAFSGHADLCEVTAVCDLDPERRAQAAEEVKNGNPAQIEDYRKILDDASIDTVSIATPDHWHTKIAIEAILAGKHVYVEKPCSHNIAEGLQLVAAAKKYNKCVQHGTQSRSGEGIQNAVQAMRDGIIGKVRMAKAINHQLRGPIGSKPDGKAPDGVNYDLWLGPAPVLPFNPNRWHYNWHWYWDYGTGDIGNDGIHQIDVARWGLGVAAPNAVSASGGQLFYEDDHQTPDTQIVTFEYDSCYLLYEMRLWTDYKMEGHDNGVVFYGDEGTLEVGRAGCFVKKIDEEPKKIGGGSDMVANVGNFLQCVKANTPGQLNAPITEGAQSAELCHLGNVATRVGRKLQFDPDSHSIKNDDEAQRLSTRIYRSGYELPKI